MPTKTETRTAVMLLSCKAADPTKLVTRLTFPHTDSCTDWADAEHTITAAFARINDDPTIEVREHDDSTGQKVWLGEVFVSWWA